MPFNLIKKYNSLLELDALNESQRKSSLHSIFKRDFIDSSNYFRKKLVLPTPKEGQETMEVLFHHLTTKDDFQEGNRYYDRDRARRVHWIRHHIQEKTVNAIKVFSVKDKSEIRTYIFDEQESYVIILAPKGNDRYYLLTAYYLEGANKEKIQKKINRKLPDIY